MTAGELRRLLVNVPDDTPVKVAYEMFAQAHTDEDQSGFTEDGEFWVVACD